MSEPSSERLDSAAEAIVAPPCRFLRSKGMYVYTDGSYGESHEDYDNTIYWCQKTQKDFGPDHAYVGRPDCCEASRGCYEGV